MRRLAAVVTGLMAAWTAAGGDWPQFLGPNRDATSRETGMSRSWPTNGPAIVWTAAVEDGYGGAAVAGGEVFVMDRKGVQDILRCLDLADGREKWAFVYTTTGRVDHAGARSVPAVDEANVYAIGPLGQFHCISRKTHTALWRKDLVADYQGSLPKWAVSQSPLLHGDKIVVAPQSAAVGVVAFDKAGRQLWASPPIGGMSYASPVVTNIGGVEQAIQVSESGVAGVRLSDGELLWRYRGWQCRIPIPSATCIGSGRVFVTGGYGAGSVMIRLAPTNGSFAVSEVFKTPEYGSQIHQPIRVGEHLYMMCNDNQRRDGLVCLRLDGRFEWKTGTAPGFDRGGMVAADGLFYAVDGQSGHLRLLTPNPNGYVCVSQVKLLKGGEKSWAPLAIADGRLLLRDSQRLLCLAIKAR